MKGQPTAFRSQRECSCCHNSLGHFAKNKFSPFEASEFEASGKQVASAFANKQLPLFWKLLAPLPSAAPDHGRGSLPRFSPGLALRCDPNCPPVVGELFFLMLLLTFLSRVRYKWKFPYSPV